MNRNWRLQEYKILIFRLLLVYFFYAIARVLFYYYNRDLLQVSSFKEFLSLAYYGLAFDTTAILYINSVFILASILPFWKNTSIGYQKAVFYIYFTCNLAFYASNFVDFIYYKYTFSRTTIAAFTVLEHEINKFDLFMGFTIHYWYVFLLYFLTAALWIFLYKKIKISHIVPSHKTSYFIMSIFSFLITITLVIGGIRGGDFQKSTRPINLLDASRHVKKTQQADLVLNTPFAIIRTAFSNNFIKPNFLDVTPTIIASKVQPIKQYHNNIKSKPNVVVFILESYGREYIGAFNKNTGIKNYKSHTPFIDSLAQYSMIFTNAHANGRQSIHGMSSVLAGIPSFKDAFTSSPYPKQKIESLVSTLKSEGYNTSFFHGAANGSMGFLGFANILGFDQYYGRTEFNDDSQFDGFWGIWDEPFLQFMQQKITQKKQPFMATVFTVSSHEPYNVPLVYKNKFKEGGVPIHKCVSYTDFSLKRFFETAKKQTWFANTIFVIVADHCNQIYYDEYQKPLNRFAVPILIYQPNSKYTGIDDDFAQQIDIYPTILDMIGYEKPFRSWGRSLFDKKASTPFFINYNGAMYQFAKGNYICVFDGKKAVGFYNKTDKDLANNLIAKRNSEMNEIELHCKAFLQDYMNRVIDRQLHGE
jgi:phosphoglycerol transferase MdoB-like AlkP superfamily enzyme